MWSLWRNLERSWRKKGEEDLPLSDEKFLTDLLWDTRSPSSGCKWIIPSRPCGIAPVGCDTRWCHSHGRPLLPPWHLIVFGMALALFMHVCTSVMWQLIPFTWHPSDVVSTHADRLMLLGYSTLHLPRNRKCRYIVISPVNWVASGVNLGDSGGWWVWTIHCRGS